MTTLIIDSSLTRVKCLAFLRSHSRRKRHRQGSLPVRPPSLLRFHPDSHQQVDFSRTPIQAIFVFHDPRNWALDTQVICDVIQSGGIVGGPYGAVPPRPIELVFCNPDLLWRSDFERPRLGQGAFREAFQAVYKVRSVNCKNSSRNSRNVR